MKLKTHLFLLSVAISFQSSAQIIEQFNSRPGISGSQVKSYLQASCWNLSSFTSSNNPEELIEGDGSLISVLPVNSAIPSGIYSPVLDLKSKVTLKFKYRLLSAFENTGSSVKIYLTGSANERLVLLDSTAIDQQVNSIFNFNRTFNNIPPGPYKIFIQYSNESPGSRLAIDDLNINGTLHYPGGCNRAPVAKADFVSLNESGISKTSITSNDGDVDKDKFKAYIQTGSPDGVIELNADNSFAFKPNPGFKGTTTEFTYRICETSNGLCSESAKVIVSLPASIATSELLDFTGEYQQAGNIDLHWNTFAGNTTRQFEIERSLDGQSWEHAGTIPSGRATTYVFNDHVNKNTANRNDILYRLKEVKNNGAILTSKLLILRVYNSPAVRMVSVTPNPAKNDINVTLQLNQTSITSMKVVSSMGTEVFRKTIKSAEGVNNILLDGTSKLQPGLYTLDVTINSKERMLVPLLKD